MSASKSWSSSREYVFLLIGLLLDDFKFCPNNNTRAFSALESTG